MNRIEIKEEAKKMIVGNKWYIWKPLVFMALILGLCGGILGAIIGIVSSEGTSTYNILMGLASFISSFVGIIFAIGYTHYILEFVRGKKMEWKETINFAKEHWLNAFLVSLIVTVLTAIGFALLVVPGIILGIGLTFYQEVFVDNLNLSPMEVVKKSWDLTNGHKMEIFIFVLSFIGWIILGGFTFGILYIWLMPYMLVAETILYERLKTA